MKRLYLDTNVFIDILLDRDLSNISFSILGKALEESELFMSTLSIHISYYICKIKLNSEVDKKVKKLVNVINLVPLSENIVNQSLYSFARDFEDTLQYYSALSADCDYILTRDKKDFSQIKEAIPSKIEIIDSLNKSHLNS